MDDTVSEAFARVLSRLLAGPDELAFRPLLLQAVRQAADSRMAATRHRRRPGAGDSSLAAGTDVVDVDLEADPEVDLRAEEPGLVLAGALGPAYGELDVADQTALWHTDVEADRPRQVAEVLGIRRGEVRARVEQSRQRLRRAYVRRHLRDETDSQCQVTAAQLVDFLGGRLSRQAEDEVGEHLDGCDRCHTLYVELVDVGRGLRTFVVPAIVALCVMAILAMGGPFAGPGQPGTPSSITSEMADPTIVRPRPTTTVTTAPAPVTTAVVPVTTAPSATTADTVAVDGTTTPAAGTTTSTTEVTDATGATDTTGTPDTTGSTTTDTTATTVTPPTTRGSTTTTTPVESGGSGWLDPDMGQVGNSDGVVIPDPDAQSAPVLGNLGPYTVTVDGDVGPGQSNVTVSLSNPGAAASGASLVLGLPASSGWIIRTADPNRPVAGTPATSTWATLAASSLVSDQLTIYAPTGPVILQATLTVGASTWTTTIVVRAA